MAAKRTRCAAALTFCVVLLTACAGAPPRPEAAPADLLPVPPAALDCQPLLRLLDREVAQGGWRDAGVATVDGHPYLRVDRLLVSLNDALDNGPKLRAWQAQARHLGRAAQAAEFANAGLTPALAQRALDCGDELADAMPEASLRAVAQAASVPDDYSTAARFFGAYWFAVPFMQLAIGGYQRSVHAQFEVPLSELDEKERLQWAAQSPAPLDVDTVRDWLGQRDALGFLTLDAERQRRLAAHFAPTWDVVQRSRADLPGRPLAGRVPPGVDADSPRTYWRLTHTRFGDALLPQLEYTVWFDHRAPQSRVDPYAGPLDAVVWRITFGDDGAPLTYDTIHACGCYHYFFAARPLQRVAPDSFWRETPVVPQQDPPAPPHRLLLDADTHYLLRVLADDTQRNATRRQYVLEPYDRLRAQPGNRAHRPLFSSDGLVRGSQRPERFWLWVSGVPSPGAMRQAGRQPTAFIGRRHFDDARLLEEVFRP